jgi:hypothetical protein
MLRRVALVRTEVSQEHIIFNVMVTTIGELGTKLAVTCKRNTLWIHCIFYRLLRFLVTADVVPGSPIPVTLMREELRSSETSILTRSIRRNVQDDGILHSHRLENLHYYEVLLSWTLYTAEWDEINKCQV